MAVLVVNYSDGEKWYSGSQVKGAVQEFLKIFFVLLSDWNIDLLIKNNPVPLNYLNLSKVDNK
jgi:hypothetical protein